MCMGQAGTPKESEQTAKQAALIRREVFQSRGAGEGVQLRKGVDFKSSSGISKSGKPRMTTAFGARAGTRSKVILHEAEHQTSHQTGGTEV